jgi:hypothetical protein
MAGERHGGGMLCVNPPLGCSISYQFSNDVKLKLANFLQLIDTIKRTMFRTVRTETTYFKIIQHFSFAYIFVWVRKFDFDSLTETKNWGGRNEVIETFGRLYPLWPQNKRLHSPRTSDRLHTRQDRWIQKELAFTPAKIATKPNPFKITPLQTTGKENNWETEETMERATVTLETERDK